MWQALVKSSSEFLQNVQHLAYIPDLLNLHLRHEKAVVQWSLYIQSLQPGAEQSNPASAHHSLLNRWQVYDR